MIRKALTAALVTAVFATLNACSGGSTPAETKSRIAPPDPTWVSSISQHSSGAISRFSPIRVFFTNDVIPDAKVNGDASANIRITPAVKTKAIFASKREIVLRPETEFEPGQQYKIEVLATGLAGLPADTKPFEFLVSTLDINFDVRTSGLNVEYNRNELMSLSGRVQTADTENREKVEKIVTATLNGKPAKVTWTSGDRHYAFVVADIL